MNKVLSGVIHLVEKDIIDILRQHFAKCGHGFKQIVFKIDQAERDKPRFEIDIKLEQLNKPTEFSPRIEKLLGQLLALCGEEIDAENYILRKLYEWIKSDDIDSNDFVTLVERIKGK